MKTIEECRKAFGRVWTVKLGIAGEFIFRKPTSREYTDFDAARVPMVASVSSGNATKATSLEFLRECEQLCVRVVVSHTAEELQAIEDEYLGVFRDLAQEIAEQVDGLRNAAGKESPPPGQP